MAEAFNHRHTSDQLLDAGATGRTVLRCATLSALWDYIGYKNDAGYVIIDGDAPSSVSAGQVAIGGGQAWLAGRLVFGAGSFVSGLSQAYTTATDGLLLVGKVGSANDFVLTSGSGANIMDVPTGGSNTYFWGSTSFGGTAPSSVSAGRVAIGGGEIRAAGAIRNPKCMDTVEGGRAILLTNRSGGNSVKGRIVEASASYDLAYDIAGASDYAPIGVEYESGIANGSECWVVQSGIAEVLLKDSTASTRGYWAKMSDTAGRADITNALPPGGTINALEDHAREIGHCLESKTAGTSVLAKITMHFN